MVHVQQLQAMVSTLLGGAGCRSLVVLGSIYSKSHGVVSGLWKDAGKGGRGDSEIGHSSSN